MNAEGRPSPDGAIVLLSVGMSNTNQESEAFEKLLLSEPNKNPRRRFLNGAQGGQTAERTTNPSVNFWKVVDQRLASEGLTPKQVQAAWLKQANIGPQKPFPAEVKALQSQLVDIVHVLHDRFPNLKIVYLSSRIYGGYARTPLNPEPHAYESGFAFKWLIADQISGKPELNYDSAQGPVRAPWLAWGPYLWADGVKSRTDGLKYLRDDLRSDDGTHPSVQGAEKVARLLLEFLKSDPTARPWFTGK